MSDAEVVVDASAVLALVKGEPFDKFDSDRIVGSWISAVNLSEVLAKLRDDNVPEDEAERVVAAFDLRVVPFDAKHARAAAWLYPSTKRAGLSLGDRACIATALALNVPVVTADRAWSKIDVGATVLLIR